MAFSFNPSKDILESIGSYARRWLYGWFYQVNAYKSGTVSVDYAAGHADATLSAYNWMQLGNGGYLTATNASGGGANLIVPASVKLFTFYNNSGQTVTVKVSGQSGVAVANTKYALLFNNGTDVKRVTADT